MDNKIQRRLSAIMAADIVGYSGLIEADEVGTLAQYRDLRRDLIDPEIAMASGRVFKEMGDGFLTEFPSAVAATDCAIALQQRLAGINDAKTENDPIVLRIGINIGDIVVEGADIFGEGVNIAARLESLAEPGGVCISGAVFQQLKVQVRRFFEFDGNKAVKNIREPVPVFRWIGTTGMNRASPAIPSKGLLPRQRRWVVVTAAVATAVFAGVTVFFSRFSEERPENVPDLVQASRTNKTAIAVLPFSNMSSDTRQEYFVDGMTDDLITDLSKISSLFVIARNSVFTYKNRSVPLARIASELGVRYILEGSVRSSGGRVRINSQLVDTETGGHVWADRFDRELDDIFALQDDVTREIVAALELELTSDEKARLTTPGEETTPEVYDLYLRGIERVRQYTPESLAQARNFLLQALAIDPDFARGHAAMAFSYTAGGIFFGDEDADISTNEALRYARRALELDDTLPQSHFALAITLLRQGDHEAAERAARQAIEFDPNYSDGYAALANILFFAGRAEQAKVSILRAMELNPHFSAAYVDILGRADFMLEHFNEAIAEFEECTRRNSVSLSCRAFLAAAYALSGQIDKGQWEAEEILNLEPGFTLKNNNFTSQLLKQRDADLLSKGLRQAGIPEG